MIPGRAYQEVGVRVCRAFLRQTALGCGAVWIRLRRQRVELLRLSRLRALGRRCCRKRCASCARKKSAWKHFGYILLDASPALADSRIHAADITVFLSDGDSPTSAALCAKLEHRGQDRAICRARWIGEVSLAMPPTSAATTTRLIGSTTPITEAGASHLRCEAYRQPTQPVCRTL